MSDHFQINQLVKRKEDFKVANQIIQKSKTLY